ncbi:MAG: hypothetical protein K2L48_03610, partial [Mycoplasmoidaceae bacterium]|nr:hypothetical protein [Mycoplasmoidaceae bacterium]
MSCNLKKNKLKKIFAFLGFAPLLTSCFFFTSCGNSNNINLSNIVIPESESVSKDNFAIFNAYDPSEVTMSEILQINKDNYVQKIISDNIKKIDNNFSFKDINISNSAKNTTYQDGKEQYIDYSFDSYKKTFNQCEIYVKSNCSKYFGEFSFKINVCATDRQCIYKDENFSDDYPSELFCFYTTLDLKLYNHNSKT